MRMDELRHPCKYALYSQNFKIEHNLDQSKIFI